jgi:hypothetical protein
MQCFCAVIVSSCKSCFVTVLGRSSALVDAFLMCRCASCPLTHQLFHTHLYPLTHQLCHTHLCILPITLVMLPSHHRKRLSQKNPQEQPLSPLSEPYRLNSDVDDETYVIVALSLKVVLARGMMGVHACIVHAAHLPTDLSSCHHPQLIADFQSPPRRDFPNQHAGPRGCFTNS